MSQPHLTIVPTSFQQAFLTIPMSPCVNFQGPVHSSLTAAAPLRAVQGQQGQWGQRGEWGQRLFLVLHTHFKT